MTAGRTPSRRIVAIAAIALSTALIAGCGSDGPTSTAGTSASSLPGAQSLPVGATLRVGATEIELEVARTPAEQETGLMFRTDLPPDRGMLFPTTRPIGMSIWMKDTLIPLDLVFVRDGVVTKVVTEAPPCTTNRCPVWSSDGPIDEVIELRGGRAAELGITTGTTLDISWR